MMHNASELYKQLNVQLLEVNKQIESIVADSSSPVYGVPADVYKLKTTHGDYVMIPLIAAKANLLSSMANLKAADTGRVTRPGPMRGGW